MSTARTHRPAAAPSLAAFLLLALLVVAHGRALAETAPQQLSEWLSLIDGRRMVADVVHLARDFNGRQSGTPDDVRSGQFVAERFRALGLQPGGTEPLEPGGAPWALTSPLMVSRIGDVVELAVQEAGPWKPADLGRDFLPVLDSPSAHLTAPIVFVGYGQVDDYADVNVRDRVVLFLRGKPEGSTTTVSHADKVRLAREHGAIGYLTATGPLLTRYEARRGGTHDPVAYYGHPGTGLPEPALPGAWISTPLAEQLVGGGGVLRERQGRLNEGRAGPSFLTSYQIRLRWEATRRPGRLVNIIGTIAGGTADERRVQPLILGAHRDHFGRQAGLLFPGADDNASGTAVLLEVARVLAQGPLRYPVLLVSFSGEEQGLLGSRAFVSAARASIADAIAMVNVDHAGIGDERLTVGLQQIDRATATRAAASAGAAERVELFGYFPGGDHVPFKEAGVPTAAVVTSGRHPHFHRPTDTAETIQPELLVMTARYLVALLWELAHDRP